MHNTVGTAVNVLAVARFEMNNINGTAANVHVVASFEMSNISGTVANVHAVARFEMSNISGTAASVHAVVRFEMSIMSINGMIATVSIASVLAVARLNNTGKMDASALTAVRICTIGGRRRTVVSVNAVENRKNTSGGAVTGVFAAVMTYLEELEEKPRQ